MRFNVNILLFVYLYFVLILNCHSFNEIYPKVSLSKIALFSFNNENQRINNKDLKHRLGSEKSQKFDRTIPSKQLHQSSTDINNIKRPLEYSKRNIHGSYNFICREFKIDSKKDFDFVSSYLDYRAIPIFPYPEIAFLGRSNVGKSSLLNCISGKSKPLAVASKTPGRTRLINIFKCYDSNGDICSFADLPGYGFGQISKELQHQISKFVNQYLLNRDALKCVYLLLDARRDPMKLDEDMIKFLLQEGIPFNIVLTKVDLLKPREIDEQINKICNYYKLFPEDLILFSSITDLGKREMWQSIKANILHEEN